MTKKLFWITLVFTSLNLFAQSPVLSNFRIEDSEKNRIYFDSNVSLTASTTDGFFVSGKSVSGITVNAGQTTGHYMTISSDFNFWDNNTIRYEGGSDMQGIDGSVLHEFTLSYIVNNIPEPDAPDNRYVTNTASGGGDGLTEATAWTMAEAFSQVEAGQTVWMKAGDYGEIYLTMSGKNGSVLNPIKFIGYKETIGDITENYWDYGVPFDSSEMPTMTGNYAFNTSSKQYGRGVYFGNTSYLIFRNFQITKYQKGFSSKPNASQANSHLIFDRVNGNDFDDGNAYGSGFLFNSKDVGNNNIRFLDMVIMNYEMVGLELKGDGFGLIDKVKIYNDDNNEKPDYQIMFNGHHNIVRNCHIEIKGDYYSASTHGIGVRGTKKLSSTYNLIEKSTALNMNESFYIRNYGSNYNVIKDCYAGNNGVVNYNYRGGVSIWGNSNYNIVERLVVDDVVTAIEFKDNPEDDTGDNAIGHHNIIRNCTFNNFLYAVSVVQMTNGATGALYDNQIVNNTFNDGKYMFFLHQEDIRNLDFINNTFTNFQQSGGTYIYQNKPLSGVTYTNNNFYNNNWATPAGVDNISVDPKFVSIAAKDFSLLPESELIDKGQVLDYVNFDFGVKSRPNGASHDIGAFEYHSSFTGSVSPDVSICNGEGAVLTAYGGTSYTWIAGGETTENITVSPIETTTYSVTIVDTNGITETLDIVVTVDEAPTVDVGEDQSICFGETITLTATGTGDFLWNTGETTESIDVSPTATTTYSVTASNACATDATDEIIVTVNPEIGLTVGSDLSICVGESTTLTATGNGDFLWSTGETTPSITVTPSATTTYTVTSTIGTCSEEESIEVTVSDGPTIDLGADQTICFGETITLTATGTGDFLWSTGETTATIEVSPTTTTTYSATASNSCATDATDEIIITVNPEIGLTVGSDVNLCIGESTTLTATGNGDFLWSTGETTASITVTPNTTTTYTVTSTIGTCSEDASVLVSISEVPTVDLGSDQSICNGETVTLTATGTGNFLWNTGETTSSITVSPTSTTTYSITSSNSCASDATDEITITVNEVPTVSLGNDLEICRGDSVILTATGSGTTYQWSTGEITPSISVSPSETIEYSVTTFSNGCSITDEIVVVVNDVPSDVDLGPDVSICRGESIALVAVGEGNFEWNTGETGNSIIVNPTTTTTYSIFSTDTTCASNVTDEITVIVNDPPTVNAGSDAEICNGDSVTLTATGIGTFLWNTGETTASITVNPSETTNYSVTSSLNGCSVTDDVIVTVNGATTINAGNDVTICNGGNVTLTATSDGPVLWSTGETALSINVSPNSTTEYTVTSGSGTCIREDSVIVTVDNGPDLNAGNDVEICNGETVTLTATSTGDFLWSNGATTASITVNPTSTTVYTVTSSLAGCSTSDDVTVTVNEASTINAGNDVSICSGENVVLTATSSGDYLWSTGETTATITVNPATTTTYSVSTTGSCGTVSDEVVVSVTAEISLQASEDITICSGETITLSATSNGDYNWSTGETSSSIEVSPSETTTYTVQSAIGDCSKTEEIIVTVNDSPTVDAGEDMTICEGEEIILTANSTGDILWSTGETEASISVAPSVTTTYTVSTTGSGNCAGTVEDSVTVNVNKKPVATADDDMIIESGTSIDLTVSGVGSFEWSTGEVGTRITVSPTVTTTYTVTATTGEGCSVEDEVVVTVVDEFVPTVVTITVGEDVVICPGDTVILEAPSGTSYLWSSGETESSLTVTPSETTIYSVKVYNGDESETLLSTVTVKEDCNTDITADARDNTSLDQSMVVYPNPTSGLLNVKLKGYNNDSRVSVYNLNGTALYSRTIRNKSRASVLKEQLDMSRYPKGVYFVQLTNNGKNETKKVIVN